MKRIVLLSLVAAVFVGCQDGTSPTDTGLETANFLISDGAHGGNVDVFFHPPLVPDPSGDPEFGDRPADPELMPSASICLLNGGACALDGVGDPLPPVAVLALEFQKGADVYRANWRTRDFPLTNGMIYRIRILLGSGAAAVELASRDVTPVKKAKGSCKAGENCDFNNGSTLPIRVRIETFAGCIASNPFFDPVTDDCLMETLPDGGSAQLEDVAKVVVDVGGLLIMSSCPDLRDENARPGIGDGLVDIRTVGDCVEITGLDVGVRGTATLCKAFDDATNPDIGDLTEAQARRMTLHRFGETDPAAVALPHAQEVIECDPVEAAPEQALELNSLDRFVRFARNTWRTVSDQVRAWIEPAPLWAKMAVRCHRGGCSSPSPFRSSFQAALPSWMDRIPNEHVEGDFGDVLVGTVVTARVKVFDSGELDPGDPAPEAVNDVRLTVKVNDVFVTQLLTGSGDFPDGTVEFEFPVVLGLTTVEFSGIGVGIEVGAATPVDNVFSAPFADATTETTLGVGTLAFSATGIQPDLIVFSLAHSPTDPVTGEDVTITAVVKNIGTAPADASLVSIAVDGEVTPPTFAVPALAPHASFEAARVGEFAEGDHSVLATADAGGTVPESDEGNNTAVDEFTAVEPSATLISCVGDPGGDRISRGFYVPEYPGVTLAEVDLFLSSRTAGAYTFSLTARSGAYDGAVIGTSNASVTLSSDGSDNRQTTFSFPSAAVVDGSLVTFEIGQVAGPAEAIVLYSVPDRGDESCPVIQTNGTVPPLDSFRRNGVHVIIRGTAAP